MYGLLATLAGAESRRHDCNRRRKGTSGRASGRRPASKGACEKCSDRRVGEIGVLEAGTEVICPFQCACCVCDCRLYVSMYLVIFSVIGSSGLLVGSKHARELPCLEGDRCRAPASSWLQFIMALTHGRNNSILQLVA